MTPLTSVKTAVLYMNIISFWSVLKTLRKRVEFQGRDPHPCPPGIVWARFKLPGRGLLPRHRHTRIQEDCAWLSLERFSSVERAPTSATETSMLLELESGIMCWRTSYSHVCFIQSLKTFSFGQWDWSAVWSPFILHLGILLYRYQWRENCHVTRFWHLQRCEVCLLIRRLHLYSV